MESYHTQSAVLMIVFNRPDTTARVFERIREAKPPRLYIAADGPRADRAGEPENCEQVRAIATRVDWPCEVKTLFRERNLGCKEAVSSAISWFFGQEEEGIILEDDCLPVNSFFRFCDIMLERYRYDTRIRHIAGSNLQFGKTWGDVGYYFSNLTHVWGWAGWRRVWHDYDKDLKLYKAEEVRNRLSNIFDDPLTLDTWEDIFRKLKAGEIDTWDYQLTFINFFNNGLSVIPNQNLISNIGFGGSSTHTGDTANPYANLPTEEMGDIVHPLYILPERQADHEIAKLIFNLEERYARHNKLSRRLKRWIKNPKV